MKESEASTILKAEIVHHPECSIFAEALGLAIQALEKQIPKKPILKNGESGSFVDYKDGHGEYKVTKWQDWVCPICGWFVGQRYNRSQNHSHDQRKCNYCNECGQKIDWSDEKCNKREREIKCMGYKEKEKENE